MSPSISHVSAGCTAARDVPPRVDYELTALGRSLSEPPRALGRWAEANQPGVVAARARFDAADDAEHSYQIAAE